jgi:hypothetical protein
MCSGIATPTTRPSRFPRPPVVYKPVNVAPGSAVKMAIQPMYNRFVTRPPTATLKNSNPTHAVCSLPIPSIKQCNTELHPSSSATNFPSQHGSSSAPFSKASPTSSSLTATSSPSCPSSFSSLLNSSTLHSCSSTSCQTTPCAT